MKLRWPVWVGWGSVGSGFSTVGARERGKPWSEIACISMTLHWHVYMDADRCEYSGCVHMLDGLSI